MATVVTRDSSPATRRRRAIPVWLPAGIVLIAVAWPIAWLQWRPVSDYYFFPLWLGYILTMDGLVLLRTGTSPIARNGRWMLLVFAASVPLWWICEGSNKIVENWHYHAPVHYGPLAYFLLASLSFSTVIPAILATAELVRSFGWNPLRRLPPLAQTRRFLLGAHLAGWMMLAAMVLFPRQAFPLVWLSMIFLLDPLLTLLGGRSIGRYLERGDWSPVFNLALAALICGWFWEMWNVNSLPKWTYSVPYVEFWHIFEMPLMGYLGYLPFGSEVFIFYMLMERLLPLAPWPRPLVSMNDEVGTSTRERSRV